MSHPRLRPDRAAQPDTPPGTPRWVKVFGILFLALILLVIVLHLTGMSPGGPSSHFPFMHH
jgi:hypothetical protein